MRVLVIVDSKELQQFSLLYVDIFRQRNEFERNDLSVCEFLLRPQLVVQLIVVEAFAVK